MNTKDQNRQWVDLHSHTIYSDGSDTPETLIRAAAIKGTEVFALTDHDTMRGYLEAKVEAEKWGMRLIPGVEVTTSKYHILGLGVQYENQAFQAFLAHSQRIQENNCQQRLEKLAGAGVPITLEKLKHYFPSSRLGKWNIILAMCLDPACKNYLAEQLPGRTPTEVFAHYLKGSGVAAKIKRDETVRSGEAIDAIHAAGGIAILAHPFLDVQTMKELDKLRANSIDGLEIQPNYGEKNNPFRAYALEYGWKITYGSDFHGPAYTRKLLGREFQNQLSIDELLSR